MYRLSKSKLLSALQCEKRLWLAIHQSELASIDESVETKFAIGHQVGGVARSLFPGGVLIEKQEDLPAALLESANLLAPPVDLILFEAAFQHEGVFVRVDILVRKDGRYHFLEVKSSTKVYDYHLQDAAIQSWVLKGVGYGVHEASILHIDSSFVYEGQEDYRKLFTEVDVTASIAELTASVPALVLRSRAMLEGPEPDIAVGKQCGEPFECPFLGYCDQDGPEYPISIFSSNWRLRDQFMAEGFRDIREVPFTRLEVAKLQRIWRSTTTGQLELDPGAGAALKPLAYPRHFLDFETIQFAVPIWSGTSPYEQIPFQWSCHTQSADGSLQHLEFLEISGQAPMRAFAESLIQALGLQGSIVVYSGFESRILGELAERFPDLLGPLQAMKRRLFDL